MYGFLTVSGILKTAPTKGQRRRGSATIDVMMQAEATEAAALTLWIWQRYISTTAALAGNISKNPQAEMRDSLTLHRLAFRCD